MSLDTIISDLETALKSKWTDMSSVSATDQFATERINPPCAFIVPGNPYIEPDTNGVEQVRLRVHLVEREGDPGAVLSALNTRLDDLRDCLHTTTRAFVLDSVELDLIPLGPNLTPRTAAIATVSTHRSYR